jgi:YbbR domain-containing protein
VEYRNLPADLEISSTPMENVSLELQGPAGELPGVGSNRRPAVVIDMSSVSPGRTTFTVGDGNVITPRGVRLVRAIPSEVQFEFEHRLTRTVPVRAQLIGQAAQGYRVLLTSVSPSTVTITGPASHVAQVRAATTDPINISTVGGAAQFHVNAFVDDPYVRMRTSPRVIVAVSTKKK